MRTATAVPSADRWHQQVTPATGGFAIVLGLLVGMTLAAAAGAVHVPWGLPLGILVACAVGAYDDLRPLGARAKLGGQAVAALVAAAGGVLPAALPWWLGTPVTVFALVACVNSLNLLDNMDGLAAGVACVAALSLAGIAAVHRSGLSPAIPLAITGACLGYLPFNMRHRRPAALFMGDAGSHGLGLALGACAVLASGAGADAGASLAAPLLALAIPIFDTTFVTVVRRIEGRPITHGGRDHTSHRLAFAGFDNHWAALALIGAGAVAGGTAVLVAFAHDWLVTAPCLGCLVGLLLALGRRLAAINDAPAPVAVRDLEGAD